MAANPQIPPHEPQDRETRELLEGRRFPWGLVAAIITIVVLAGLAFYFFR